MPAALLDQPAFSNFALCVVMILQVVFQSAESVAEKFSRIKPDYTASDQRLIHEIIKDTVLLVRSPIDGKYFSRKCTGN